MRKIIILFFTLFFAVGFQAKIREEVVIGQYSDYIENANAGKAFAQYLVGQCYEYGSGIDKNNAKALYWYKKAAMQGVAEAQYSLGVSYYNGIGTTQDKGAAVSWLLKAAEQGHEFAQQWVGCCFYYGNGTTIDYRKAVYWLQKAVDQENERASYYLGLCYFNGDGVTKDYSKAVSLFEEASAWDVPEAQNMLGLCYMRGYGVSKDYKKAIKWYETSAKKGNYASAYNNLGYCYEHGFGVTKDTVDAIYHYKKAISINNYHKSMYHLACIYLGQKKYNEALDYINEAINLVPDESKYIYVKGEIFARKNDFSLALEMWNKIIEQDASYKEEDSYLKTYITSYSQPPLLAMVDNSLQLIEQTANNTIDANEQCKIRLKMTNNGKGEANGCEVKVKGTGSTAGLTFSSQKLSSIPVGTTQTIEIPVTANMNTIDGVATFTIEVTEPNGYGIDPMTLTVNTRAFDAPLVKIVDYAVSGNGTIQKKLPFDLQLLLQNTKYGRAEDVDVNITVPTGVSLWEGQEQIHYATLDGGEQHKLNYQLAISGNYSSSTVPINISIKEKYGKFAENKIINLSINQQLTSSTSVTLQGQKPQVQRDAIVIGSLGSDVDKNIPVSKESNQNSFAFIIANENYQRVSAVPMALNDGIIFKQYCQKALGLPAENIKYYSNATLGNMASVVQQARDIASAYNGNISIIFYYAGHGIPDNETKEAYLLPIDASGAQTAYCYSTDRLYNELGNTNAKKIIVLLDACFSGTKRGDGMLASARGVALKAKTGIPQGNMVVLSAATGDQTAFPYEAEGHGMFTYFVLKKLQETHGNVTIQDLYEYVQLNVSQKTSVVNNKLQTPTISASASLGDNWTKWTLK